jgi:hypothetical protein
MLRALLSLELKNIIAALWCIALGLCCEPTKASITLPLQGYCRPGRYFPVLIDSSDAGKSLTITSEGCLPTWVNVGSGRRVVPVLVTGFPTSLSIDGASFPLHVPGEKECLIGALTADVSPAAGLFPNRRMVPIALDAVEPIPGPPAAWETLDAILLDPVVLSRISDSRRSALLSAGVMLFSNSDAKPDNRWPWQQRGSLWVLSYAPAGPVGEVIDEDVYGPTYAMTTGWPRAVRQQVMGIAILLVLITLSLLLRPSRGTFAASVLIILFTTFGIILWRRSLSTMTSAGGDILVAKAGLVQRDAWVYQRARETARHTVPWGGWMHPIFGSRAGITGSEMTLAVARDDSLQFNYTATGGHTMAFVRREVTAGEISMAHLVTPVGSPMSDAARSVYLTTGTRIAGETDGGPARWPSVVVSEPLPGQK